jgi:alkylation response protein AidB-like acyl-CoA dehydrogenase
MTSAVSDPVRKGPRSQGPGQAAAARLQAGGSAEILAAARRVAAVLRDGAERHDRDGSYAAGNIAAIWDAGLGNLTLPFELGGLDADLTTTANVVELLAGADPSTALIFVMHLVQLRSVAASERRWPSSLQDRIVADSLAGPALINLLRVEPELGTPARGGVPATKAVRVTGRDGRPAWRLSGRKTYCTGSYGLRWLNVWAATVPEDPDGERVGSFLVPAGLPGIEIVETWDHLGMRATVSHDIVLRDVEIPFDHAVGLQAPDRGQDAAARRDMVWLTTLVVAVYAGVFQAGRDWLAAYLNERAPTNLGAPLASLPRFQAAVGEIEALAYTNKRLLSGLAAEVDAGGEQAEAALTGAGLVKVVVTANVIRGLELAVGLVGNPGLSYHHPLQRHYRNALCGRVHTPHDDSVLGAVGRAVLGNGQA